MSEGNKELCGKYRFEAASPPKICCSYYGYLCSQLSALFPFGFTLQCGPAMLLPWLLGAEKGLENAALWPQTKIHGNIPSFLPSLPPTPPVFIFKFQQNDRTQRALCGMSAWGLCELKFLVLTNSRCSSLVRSPL